MRRQGLVQIVRLVAVSLVAAGLPMPARAQVDNPTEDLLRDRFVIDLGGFVVTSMVNGSLRDSANTSDQNINFDKQFRHPWGSDARARGELEAVDGHARESGGLHYLWYPKKSHEIRPSRFAQFSH